MRDLARVGTQYLAAGAVNYRTDGGKEALFLARINANGTLDAGYGTDGVATTVLGDAGWDGCHGDASQQGGAGAPLDVRG